MMILLLSFVARIALGEPTPAPTVPTPYPTITPAPESLCTYQNTDNGPFALDCLQAEFLKVGCSVRGDSYPTETRDDTQGDDPEADKEWYNAATWQQVKDQLQAVRDAGGNDCFGDDSGNPSPSPTEEPTTKAPTPSPTIPPTLLTPSPSYAEDYAFTEFYTNDGSSPATKDETAEAAETACINGGYARQYDMTQYVLALEMDGKTDYFTTVPQAQDTGYPTSICDMIKSPSTVTTLWSDSPNGPFIEVDLTADTPTMFDSRVYPSWLNRGDDGAGGYGGLPTQGGRAYKMSMTSYRSYSTCTERVAPQTETTGVSEVFDESNTHCKRQGTSLQDWDNTAAVCNGADSTALHYALANRMYSTCDDFCVYSPDYPADKVNNEYWFWVAGDNCWKPRDQYGANAFQECDTEHNDFTAARQLAYDHVLERMAMLCDERCDYVGGWTYVEGSCYKPVSQSTYSTSGTASDVQAEKAEIHCQSLGTDSHLASLASKEESAAAVAICDGVCYLGNNPATKGTADGDWRDGSKISYVNFWNGKESLSSPDGDYLALQLDASWKYTPGDENFKALCEMPADTDTDESNEANARACVEDNADHDETKVPSLDIAESGFTDKDAPADLHFIVNVPQTMYNAKIAFEKSTNDAGEYHWSYNTAYWNLKTAATSCTEDNVYEGAIPWTVFNLGGAGGVIRQTKWTDETDTEQTTTDEADTDGSNAKYIFTSIMRIEATVPVMTSIDTPVDDPTHKLRIAEFDRSITVRIPFVLQFQKTVTVATEVDIVSTKFNYKTVAAIIQSIQYETQYFEPPYAKVMLQIRTKSQYPYLFNNDVSTINLYPVSGFQQNNNVNMSIEWLQDDSNCTFTNPDHMREGDVCTQEWMLYLTPNDNVCYATGEYTIEYLAGCFYGKDVCYLPFDNNGDEITTVSFTFKLQTSKFCPQIADEVDLAGTLSVTGRQSFKPTEETVEGDTSGSMYFQGETIHLFATTHSDKASITSTKVVMVEIEQDLSELVQTGYNRVPFDQTSTDLTVWTAPAPGRVADGTVTINDGTDATSVILMEDADVYPSGHDFGSYTFSAKEAGFKILIHARAFPVNVDSFGVKKILATLEVTYEALSGITRRRLLSADPTTDLRSQTAMRVNAFRGESKPRDLGETASMSLYMTLQANLNRANVKAFSDSFRDAVVSALNDDVQSQKTVYEDQVAVDAVWTDGNRIWSRPRDHRFGSRRLLEVTPAQRLRVDFTFAKVNYANSMDLGTMIEMFYQQLKQPASELMQQNIFYGSVIHKCTEAPKSDYVPPSKYDSTPGMGDTRLMSSASMAVPFAALSLIVACLL